LVVRAQACAARSDVGTDGQVGVWRTRFDARGRLAYAAPAMSPKLSSDAVQKRNPPRGPRLATARAYQEAAPRMPEEGLDLLEVFPGCADIEVEIGFGRGQFLVQRRHAAPQAGLLGIEIRAKHAYLVADKCARLALPNVRILGGDARLLLPQLRPAGSVARVVMCFPDPWWKARHAERRLMDEPLLNAIATVLRPAGELFVQTDVEERAEQYLERISACAAFQRATATGYIDENPYGAQSNRESRAIEDGLPIYRLLFRKA
jgi:tRNA (guanine-N7-)-methyltransferase